MLFPDYTKAVLRDYQEKSKANKLPLELISRSPAKLRDACLAVCHERYDRKDERVLKAFFGNAADKSSCLQAIERCDIDKFRPLASFLKDPGIRTDVKNVELLAWLVDYKGRPYGSPPREPEARGETAPEPRPEPAADTGEEEGPDRAAPKKKKRKKKRLVIVVSITIVFAAVCYVSFRGRHENYISGSRQPVGKFRPGPQACMFWADDHYQSVSCNENLGDTLVIALDSEKLLHFRKITRPDTITEAAIGHVWYVRYRGNYEFYTAGGHHPDDPNLRLRPITAYIIAKHLSHN